MRTIILSALRTALSNLDWDFVTPSRVDYGDAELSEPAAQRWQERLFAYELYHQLRLLWMRNPALRAHCVIHAEIRKGYQHMADFDYMPDFLFHLPQPGQNRAVAEVKLASSPLVCILADLTKLVRFREVFEYDDLIQILIGNDTALQHVLSALSGTVGTRIHLLCVSTDTRIATQEIIQYSPHSPMVCRSA